MATLIYDFADGTIPADFVQTPSSPAATIVAGPNATYANAMQLQDLGDNTTAEVRVVVNIVSPGSVTFWREFQGEATYDYAKFLSSDGTTLTTHYDSSGDGAWAEVTFALPVGEHALIWQFTKDAAISYGFDNHRIAGIRIDGVEGAATPASLPIQDTFDRADSTTLGTSSNGWVWANIQAGWQVASNTAQIPAASTEGVAVHDTGLADPSLQFTVASNPTYGDIGFVIRYVDDNNWVRAFLRGVDASVAKAMIYSRVNGTYNPAYEVPTTRWSAGDKFRVEANGSSYSIFKNTIKVASWIEAANSTATKHGLFGSSTSSLSGHGAVDSYNLDIIRPIESLPFSDNFDRPNGELIASNPDGWKNSGGINNHTIANNYVYRYTGGGSYPIHPCGRSDHSVQAKFYRANTQGSHKILVACNDTGGDYVSLSWDCGATAHFVRTLTGTGQATWSLPMTSVVSSSGTAVVKLVHRPLTNHSEYDVYQDGVFKGTLVDTVKMTGTWAGIDSGTSPDYVGQHYMDDVLMEVSVAPPNPFGDLTPTGLTASQGLINQIQVTWDGVDGNLKADGTVNKGYELLRDGVVVYTGITSEYLDSPLNDGASHVYTVRSFRHDPDEAPVYSDTFDTAQTGLPAPWQVHSGTYAIENGKAVLTDTVGGPNANKDGLYYATRPDIATTTDTIEVSTDVEFPAPGAQHYGGVFWGWQSHDNLWYLRLEQASDGTWHSLVRKYTDAIRQLSIAATGLTVTANRIARIKITHNRGTDLVVAYVNDVEVARQAAVGTKLNAGRQGIGFSGSTLRQPKIDNFLEKVL